MPKWRKLSRDLFWRLIQFLSAILYIWNILFMVQCVSAEITVEYRVLDNITAGTAIGNMETDAELADRFTHEELSIMSYFFLPSTLHHQNWHHFKLSPETGILRTVDYVDRDEICPQMSQCDIQLSIAIKTPVSVEIVRVVITLDDYNDNAPKFAKNVIKMNVMETVSPGLLLQLQPALDPDSPENGVRRYSLLCDKELFQLVVSSNSTPSDANSESGDSSVSELSEPLDSSEDVKIMLLQSLDREYKAVHELMLIAYDGGRPQHLQGNVTIIIKVNDVNDNSPKFLKPSVTAKVLENAKKGSLVIYMSAFDPDDGANGKIVYSFSNETARKYGNVFKIKEHGGKITLKGKLDYERKTHYTLQVIANDSGPNSFPAMAKVIVEVIDLNDNRPDIVVEPQNEDNKLVVVENRDPGAYIAHISAHDIDSSQNGIVSCKMDEPSYETFELMQLFQGEYKLVTRERLDREVKASYDIIVSCRDMGNPPMETTVTFHLIILDENDHMPKFDRDIYECALLENTPNQTNLLHVKADEPDSGVNGIISYKLDKDAGRAFVINESTGVIDVVTAFNRETVGGLIEFHVLAIDNAIEPQTSTATVRVSVLDIDDNAPKFVKPKYIFHIFENTVGETLLGHVSASDSDEYPFNKFSYYVNLDPNSDEQPAFHVDPKTGEVWAKRMFDREKHQWHYINITAQSDDKPNFWDHTLVQVYVKDRNDNHPNITFPSINNDKVYVSSLIKIGTEISQVKAFDMDEGLNSKLLFFFPKAKMENVPFTIQEETGQVFVSGNISSFVHKAFVVELEVRDRGLVPMVTKTIVSIIVTNKISQQNTWDRERMKRDRGMSMNLRVIILVMVVVLAVVFIFGASMVIRVWVVRRKKGFDSNLSSLHINSNGYIPGSMQYGSDTGEEDYLDTEEERWIVQSQNKSSISFEDLTQPFDSVKTGKSEDSYDNKSSHRSSSLSPTTSYSTETQQSGVIHKQRHRTLPQAPSSENCKVVNSWKTSSYGSIEPNSFKKYPERLANGNIKKAAGDLYRNYSMDSNGVIYRNKHADPDLQRPVDKGDPKYQAFPDLVLHPYKKRIVQFSEGSKTLHTKPYEDLWNKIHLNKDRLKHSIPGHCTILDKSETSNEDSVSNSSGTNKKTFGQVKEKDQRQYRSFINKELLYNSKETQNPNFKNKWQTLKYSKDLNKPVIRVEAPTPTPNCDMKLMQRQPRTTPPGNKQMYANNRNGQLRRSYSFNEEKDIPLPRYSRTHYNSALDIGAKNMPGSRDHNKEKVVSLHRNNRTHYKSALDIVNGMPVSGDHNKDNATSLPRNTRTHYKSDLDIGRKNMPVSHEHSREKVMPFTRNNRPHHRSALDIGEKAMHVRLDHNAKLANGYHDPRTFTTKVVVPLEKSKRPMGGHVNDLDSHMYTTHGKKQDQVTRTLAGYNPKLASSSQKPYLSTVQLGAGDSDSSYI